MRNSTDAYLRQALKNWAADQQPPENGHARLLLLAASPPPKQAVQQTGKQITTDYARYSRTPSDQAMQIYNLPWLWVAHFSFTPIRRVT
jgi:hypothetical protein